MISCVFLSSIGVRPIVVGGGGGGKGQRRLRRPSYGIYVRSSGKARMIQAKTLERKHYKIMLLAGFPTLVVSILSHFRFNSD